MVAGSPRIWLCSQGEYLDLHQLPCGEGKGKCSGFHPGGSADSGGPGAGSWESAFLAEGSQEPLRDLMRLGRAVILSSQELPPSIIPNFISLACLFNKLILFNP